MRIDRRRSYRATLVTSDGTMVVALEAKEAPLAVNSFVFLARHRFFDGEVFHRIVKGLYIQTGDPTGTGYGNPGYFLRIEKPKHKYTVGTVAMARTSQPRSNGSQFFVIIGRAGTQLAPKYTIIGHVVSGMSVARRIGNTPVTVNPGTNELSMPIQDVTLRSVRVK